MKFNLDSIDAAHQHTDCVIVGLFEQMKLTPAAKQVDKISKNYLTALLKQGDFEAKSGDFQRIYFALISPILNFKLQIMNMLFI